MSSTMVCYCFQHIYRATLNCLVDLVQQNMIFFLVTIAVFHSYSANVGTNVSIFFSVIKTGLLVIIIVGGIVQLGQGTLAS